MRRWVTIAGLVVLGATAAPAADQNDAIMSLKGLPGVGVVIEGLPERSTNPAVLAQDVVTADARDLLQRAGIRLLSTGEWKALPSQPHVGINLASDHTPTDTYFDMVLISLRQRATLASGQSLVVYTWQDGATGRSDGTNHAERLRALVKEQLERFINSWRVANR